MFLADTNGEFNTAGSLSSGSLTVAIQPAPGDTVTLATQYGVPIVTEVLVAGTDFAVGVDEAATALNLAAAMSAGALVDALSAGAVVTVVSKSTGPIGVLTTVASDAASIVWADATLLGGDLVVNTQLACACLMINLEIWKLKASCAHVYLTAHMVSVMGFGSGESGQVTAKGIDKLSISYAATGKTSAHGNTSWGRMYDAMFETLLIPGMSGPASPRGLFVC